MPNRRHSPAPQNSVVAATIPPLLKKQNNSAAAGRVRDGEKTSRLQSRAITYPWGSREKKIPQGTWEFISTCRGLFEASTAMYSEERKRFPKELFLPGFPTRNNLQTGTEDSSPPSHHPEPRPDGGVLIPQSPPPFLNSLTSLINIFIFSIIESNAPYL